MSVLWAKKFITLAIKQSVDRPYNRSFQPDDHYRDLSKSSKLWKSILTNNNWNFISLQSFS